MDKFVIRGGTPLLGTIRVSGAKNAALPAMAAALLTEEPVILENIPQVRDIITERNLLAAMGAEVELGYGRAHHRTTLCCRKLVNPEASYELVKTMRASTLVLGTARSAYRDCKGLAARRLRHWRPSYRPSYQGPGKAWCGNHPGPRVHRGTRGPAEGRRTSSSRRSPSPGQRIC